MTVTPHEVLEVVVGGGGGAGVLGQAMSPVVEASEYSTELSITDALPGAAIGGHPGGGEG